nr:BID domain-containing T4SS effector [Bartonella washoeensis]
MLEQNFFYPDSKTLKNKYGIMDKTALKEQCAHDASKEMINLRQEPLPEKIDSSYLKYIHQRLFQHTFEWAGYTRDQLFTFADGTTASMPAMQKEDAEVPFAIGPQIQKGLENLDRILTEKNYLKGLSRETFVEQAAELFVSLNNTHPFREGNGRAQRMFFEKLGQSAGHNLDFSLVTKGRMVVASVAAAQNSNLAPMKHLFEDISNPEKCRILKDFLDHMKNIGGDDIHYHYVVAANEGIIYEGKYIACGAESFLMDINGRFIIGKKEHLTAEQLKTLKPGNKFTFTVPVTKDLDATRGTKERVEPITQKENLEKLKNSASLQAKKEELEHFSKLADDNSHILPDTIELMKPNSQEQEREQITQQISHSAHSLVQTQKECKETILQISDAIKNDITAAQMAERTLSHDPKRQQQHSPKAMECTTISAEKLNVAPLSFPHEQSSSSLEAQENNLLPLNFYYPNSVTLKNKYGIKDYERLQVQCAHDSARAMINLRQEATPQRLTSAYLLYIHHTLFKNTFEWAGHTRDKPFSFADGTTASAPKMKKANISFASGKKVQEGLDDLDRTLNEKNNLKGLTRKAFVKNAAEMMIQLNYMHPFKKGNGRTQRMFFEKLAEVAGHKLDFSLVTKERMNLASIASLQSGDAEPMKHLFDDISDPEKTTILKEFMDHMKNIGFDNINHRVVITAKEDETYTGFYRGGGANSFMIDANGTFIIGNKKHLTPERLKTLKIGDAISFTAPKAQDLQQILIPKEKIAPLTRKEITERIKNHTSFQASKQAIEALCKIVYDNPHILEDRLEMIHENPLEGERLACQIIESPRSISKLAGSNIGGMINNARACAEESILPLCIAIDRYGDTFKQAEKDILQNHYMEQKRCEQSVEIPGKWFENLSCLSKKQQQEALSQSFELREEIRTYSRKINARLSASEHEAIKENNDEKIAKTIGTSVNEAQKIIKIVKYVKELQQSIRNIEFSFHKFDEHLTRNVPQSMKENNNETLTKTLGISAIKAEKVTETAKQEKAVQQNVQTRKVEQAKVVAL